MLKVLIITTVKVGYDGLTNHIFSYIKNMDKADMQIDLVSARGTDEKIVPQLNKVGFHEVYRLEYRDINQYKYIRDLTKLIRENRYDIVHAHGNSATLAIDMLAGMLAGCKVRIAHSHTTSCQHTIFNACLKPLFKFCYTDGFACGQEAGRWLFGNKAFTVWPNGKEIDKYKFDSRIREEYRQKLSLSADKIAIGHVAAFVKMKNHKFCLSVFDDLNKVSPDYEMFLFGIDGETLEDVKAQIRELGLEDKVHYMGVKDNIEDYMQAMDIMLLPSLYEGFSSAIEWQIAGLPCLLSDTIPHACNILGNVIFLPIDQGTKPWTDAILSTRCNVDRRVIPDVGDIFTKAGFNIEINAAKLKKTYLDLSNKRNRINADR